MRATVVYPFIREGAPVCIHPSDVVSRAGVSVTVTLTFPLLFLQLLYDRASIKASFIFISVCSAWHVGRTLLLMPRGHIPYPLPADYRYG